MRRASPWWLVAPGLGWLTVFYLIPAALMFSLSLQEGSVERGFRFTWRWSTFSDVVSRYDTQLLRSLVYGAIVAAVCLLIAYPLAYTIAFRSGRWRNVLTFLVVLPFFVSLVIRTLSWKFVLSDHGFVLDGLRALGVGEGLRILATPGAVIGGLVYDFLPFAILPLIAALSRIDPRTLEAAGDLYASRWTRFRTVTLPQSASGVAAAVALTFIPAVGDFVHAALLGGPNTIMIGNVIQREFLVVNDYPAAAALSVVLMGAILIAIGASVRLARIREVVE
jgi:spermidine/putrescine transport system permease protein